jgi:UDPglucose 6-dehydrogenase
MQRPAKPFTPVRFRIQPPDIMKIGIIGYGFVGKALNEGLEDNTDVLKVDPKLNTSIDSLSRFCPDAVFICLPTPMKVDGTQDISILLDSVKTLKELNLNCLVIIKSTIIPENIRLIENILPKFVYNPEFLREKHASKDFIESKLIVFGGEKASTRLASNLYKNHTKCICKDYVFTDTITASLIKYTINSFLATKVIFFNELYNLFSKVNNSETWENFISFLAKDKRIGGSHMMVPGHDERFGFGGACFPKDTSALLKYAESNEVNLEIIKKVIEINNKIRNSYDKQTNRETEQNISFNCKDNK